MTELVLVSKLRRYVVRGYLREENFRLAVATNIGVLRPVQVYVASHRYV